jgi:murein DD-endopeptidase MepM/ murein hydrolase activator NlpD
MGRAYFLVASLALAFAHCAQAEDARGSPLYRLPYPDGHAYTITQAPGGYLTTHLTPASRYAVDFAMPEGTPVLAARAGVVAEAEGRHGSGADDDPLTDSGNYVRVHHADGTIATYAHLRHAGLAVAVGEMVEAGRLLGYSGTTGFSSGPHLHFAVSRMERSGEISLPVTFYVGVPPVPFAPRPALMPSANYSTRAEVPRTPLEKSRLVAWKPPTLAPGEEDGALAQLAAWLAFGLAGMLWFWRFSRR